MVSFTYGTGWPALWSHANLDEATHDWIRGEFAEVPFTFFHQMDRSIRAGHLVPVSDLAGLPSVLRRGTAHRRPVRLPRRRGQPLLPAGEPAALLRALRGPPAGQGRPAPAPGLWPPRCVPRQAGRAGHLPADPRGAVPMSLLLPLARRRCPPPRRRCRAVSAAWPDGTPWSTGSRSCCPSNSARTPALMAAFPVDGERCGTAAARRRAPPGAAARRRGLLVVTVVNYVMTDIGRYVEYSLAIACTFGAPAGTPAAARPAARALRHRAVRRGPPGQQRGLGEGRQGDLGDAEAPGEPRLQHRTGGQQPVRGRRHARRPDRDRPTPGTALPLDIGAVNYCIFRGLVMRSSIYFRGAADIAFGRSGPGTG